MATVRLNNLVRPKQINTQQTKVSDDTFDNIVYTDLHLDLKMAVANGTDLSNNIANDIKVSFDEDAISNSIRNCIYTKPGEKVLDPDFGMNLDQFLFQPISEINGDYIGRYILNRLTVLEPRINILKIKVNLLYDQNTYGITVVYEMPSINKKSSTDIFLKSSV